MATIYLIRHGQASFGSDDYDQLSQLGIRQAEVTGEYFRESGIFFDAAYSGDLKRQIDTSQLVLASQPATFSKNIDSRFNEIRNDEQLEYLLPEIVKARPDIASLVDRGLVSSKDYQKAIDAVFNFWISDECNHPEIQSWHDYSTGVRNALSDVVKNQGSGKTIAVFTSGGTIATIVAQVLGLSGKQTYSFYEPMFNCAVTQLFYNQERISLSYFNDRSFLQVLGRFNQEKLVTYR
ncbi:MAG: phosphoglycerate mutase family protein [Halieaceae bacterium]|nr:phosphoglycerate mutase family protein [Halieaceae bacterium]